MDLWLKIFLGISLACASFAGKYFFSLKNDNPLEEYSEGFLEEEMGILIDFSAD